MLLHSIAQEKRITRLRHPAPDYSRMSVMRRIALKCQRAKTDIDHGPRDGKRGRAWRLPDALIVGRNQVGVTGWAALGLRGGAE